MAGEGGGVGLREREAERERLTEADRGLERVSIWMILEGRDRRSHWVISKVGGECISLFG